MLASQPELLATRWLNASKWGRRRSLVASRRHSLLGMKYKDSQIWMNIYLDLTQKGSQVTYLQVGTVLK